MHRHSTKSTEDDVICLRLRALSASPLDAIPYISVCTVRERKSEGLLGMLSLDPFSDETSNAVELVLLYRGLLHTHPVGSLGKSEGLSFFT